MAEPLTMTAAAAVGAALVKIGEQAFKWWMQRDQLTATGALEAGKQRAAAESAMVTALWAEIHRMNGKLESCQEHHLECQRDLARIKTLYEELKADFDAHKALTKGGN